MHPHDPDLDDRRKQPISTAEIVAYTLAVLALALGSYAVMHWRELFG